MAWLSKRINFRHSICTVNCKQKMKKYSNSMVQYYAEVKATIRLISKASQPALAAVYIYNVKKCHIYAPS